MPDFSVVTASLQSIKVAIDLLKEAREVARSLQNAELQLKLANLAEALADAKLKIVEVQEENLHLREELAQLKLKQDLRSRVTKRDNVYVPQAGEIDGYGTVPWCTNCFDTQGTLISLHHKVASSIGIGNHSVTSYKWECPNCKSSVSAPRR
jgi:rRNA maturation endonuclease Nob1